MIVSPLDFQGLEGHFQSTGMPPDLLKQLLIVYLFLGLKKAQSQNHKMEAELTVHFSNSLRNIFQIVKISQAL